MSQEEELTELRRLKEIFPADKYEMISGELDEMIREVESWPNGQRPLQYNYAFLTSLIQKGFNALEFNRLKTLETKWK